MSFVRREPPSIGALSTLVLTSSVAVQWRGIPLANIKRDLLEDLAAIEPAMRESVKRELNRRVNDAARRDGASPRITVTR